MRAQLPARRRGGARPERASSERKGAPFARELDALPVILGLPANNLCFYLQCPSLDRGAAFPGLARKTFASGRRCAPGPGPCGGASSESCTPRACAPFRAPVPTSNSCAEEVEPSFRVDRRAFYRRVLVPVRGHVQRVPLVLACVHGGAGSGDGAAPRVRSTQLLRRPRRPRNPAGRRSPPAPSRAHCERCAHWSWERCACRNGNATRRGARRQRAARRVRWRQGVLGRRCRRQRARAAQLQRWYAQLRARRVFGPLFGSCTRPPFSKCAPAAPRGAARAAAS